MIDKQVALVTGGSRGIGRAIVESLAKVGYGVVINYRRSEDQARKLADRIVESGATARIIQADIAKFKDRQALMEFLKSEVGRIDLLVNNAGQAPPVRADLLDADEDSFDHLIETNLKGPYFLTQFVANWMIELQKILTDYHPKIVFITSVSAELASTNRGDYCISKAGLSMAATLFAVRLADHGINVYEIRPGIIATDMTAGSKEKYDQRIAEGLVPQGRWGRPEDVARAVEAVAGGLLPFSSGAIINVDGGLRLQRL